MQERIFLLLAMAVVIFSQSIMDASAAWPHLGEQATNAQSLPTTLDPESNTVWKIDLPGPGASTPLVVGDRLYVTCEIEGENGIVCLDAGGNERWRHTQGKGKAGKHRNATGANSSPASDGTHVVAYYKDMTLVCYTKDGKPLWDTNLAKRYGKDTLWWDLATSPVITSAGVAVAVMQEGESYLVTFDLQSGSEVWRTDRNYECARESDQSYTTPHVVDLTGPNGATEAIITFGADHITAHDTKTGKLLSEVAGMNPENLPQWRTIASAAIGDGMVVAPFGRGDYVAGIPLAELGKKLGNASESKLSPAWVAQQVGADVPTPFITDGKAYVLGDKGEITCLDINTGKPSWSAKLPRSKDKYFSSPLVVGDRIYCFREDGMAFVCQLDADLEVLGKSDLEEQIVATPVVMDGDLIVRSRDRLYRFTAK